MRTLQQILRRIDGKGYGAYKELQRRVFHFGQFDLYVDHIQGDPFAAPSRFRIRVPQSIAKFPPSTYATPSRHVALQDFLVRRFWEASRQYSERRGSGKSGQIFIDPPGQEILERSACQVTQEYVELRFFAGLPAAGRRILGHEAEEMLVRVLPRLVQESLLYENLPQSALVRHIETAEDADAARDALSRLGLVAFIADGSILPRRSGVDDRPMPSDRAIPFQSPPSLRITLELPNRGKVTGMGIPQGVTLIVGGGFHGKSTLLRAIERGVYNHIPGDGRELVVTDPTAVKIRAEDGRSVVGVDISPFIGELPGGVETRAFTTENASGSTSQAANIMEALEAGSKLLLLDEDTCATNFMIRDQRMQALIEKSLEPITPFVDKVRLLYRDYGVSTLLVMGGSGDYFDVADTVIAMVRYQPKDVTQKAKEIAQQFPTRRQPEGGATFGAIPRRIPLPESLSARRGKREVYLKARGTRTLVLGRQEIDLSSVEQLVEDGQVKAIGEAMVYALERYLDGRRPLHEILLQVMKDLKTKGLDTISRIPYPPDLVAFRAYEFAAALNRIRSLRVRIPKPS